LSVCWFKITDASGCRWATAVDSDLAAYGRAERHTGAVGVAARKAASSAVVTLSHRRRAAQETAEAGGTVVGRRGKERGGGSVGLLQEIIAGVTAGSKPVSELLRSMQVLAKRGGAGDLEEWVRKESNGYGDDDVLPKYRGPFSVNPLAHLSGPFGSEVKRLPIGGGAFPEQFQELFSFKLYWGIKELEDMADQGPEVHLPWSADAIGYANGLINAGKIKLIPMHGLVSVYIPVSRAALVRAVDAVRGRTLDLALELEQVSPELGDVAGSAAEHKEEISAKFQMNITADTVNVGESYGVAITSGDSTSLARYLHALGVEDEAAINELTEAAETAEAGDLQREQSRLKKTVKKVGGLIGVAGVNSGVQLATKAGEGYLGMGP